MHTSEQAVRDRDFVRRVRRYSPSSLLPLIASTSAQYSDKQWWKPVRRLFPSYRPYRPWALAEVARVSLACGSEFNRKEATAKDLEALLNLHTGLSDPYVHNDARTDPDALWSFMLRITSEQFLYQQPVYPNLARTAAVLTFTEPNKPLERLVDGWEQELLGCSLSEYVGITLLLHTATQLNAGRVDLDSFALPEHRFITDVLPAELITKVAEQHFVTDQERFQRANERRVTNHPDMRRYEYNPLRSTPLVDGYGPGLIAPCSHLVAPKASLLSLYYEGGERFGNAFARDLGTLFEQYVGRQLRLITNADVHPELTYGPKKNPLKSVDWIVVFDDLVLLVEVKSTRPDQEVRLGTDKKIDRLLQNLKKGYEQIDRTADAIRSRATGLESIPADRPVHGLIVTMESFDTANAPFQRQYQPQTDTFVTVTSAAELEDLVVLTDGTLNELLLTRAADPERSTYSLREALTGRTVGHNPVLEEAWASYPWSRIATGGPGTPEGDDGAAGLG